jgi:RNA polymerase sigma-70 factor (ECF subfamily)
VSPGIGAGDGRPEHARFEALYQSTRADLLAYLRRRAPGPEDAADALAETYLIAWDKLDVIPRGDQARLWLFGVARHVNLRGVRRRRVGDELVARLAGELRTADAEFRLEDTKHQRLRDALAELPERDREILTLTAWEELTPREIATVLGGSANAVRIRLHRARSRLVKQLESAPPAGDPCAATTDW